MVNQPIFSWFSVIVVILEFIGVCEGDASADFDVRGALVNEGKRVVKINFYKIVVINKLGLGLR